MRPPLPIWSIPLLLAIVGIVLFVGNLSPLLMGVVAAETVLTCGYLLWRVRRRSDAARPITNVLSLMPGHMLILLMVSFLGAPDRLAALWALIPAVSVAYDAISLHVRKGAWRTSTLIGLYAILWAVPIALLERVIAIRRGLDKGAETIAVIAFAVVGVVFISLGIYRHWRTDKE